MVFAHLPRNFHELIEHSQFSEAFVLYSTVYRACEAVQPIGDRWQHVMLPQNLV